MSPARPRGLPLHIFDMLQWKWQNLLRTLSQCGLLERLLNYGIWPSADSLFNARHGNEPSMIALTDWDDALKGTWINSSWVESYLPWNSRCYKAINSYILSKGQKRQKAKLNICYSAPSRQCHLRSAQVHGVHQAASHIMPLTCKGHQLVLVIVRHNTVEPLKLLVNQSIRDDSTVYHHNIHLFAITHLSEDNTDGWHAVQRVCGKVAIPVGDINATKVRQYIAEPGHQCLRIFRVTLNAKLEKELVAHALDLQRRFTAWLRLKCAILHFS